MKKEDIKYMVKIEGVNAVLNDFFVIDAVDMSNAVKKVLKYLENKQLTTRYHITINIDTFNYEHIDIENP